MRVFYEFIAMRLLLATAKTIEYRVIREEK